MRLIESFQKTGGIVLNLLHLKYAVEIEKTGSISKAAENLYMGQPHLSKAIRELEDSLGIALFNRSSKGVSPTARGREFLDCAKSVLAQVDKMEEIYKPSCAEKQKFDISVPRASYISYAFTEFVKALDLKRTISLNYRETNSVRAIKNVANSINNLAIIRYPSVYEPYFLNSLKEKNLQYKEIRTFEQLLLMSVQHPLAKEESIDSSALALYTELVYGDSSVPSLPITEAREIAALHEEKKSIAIYERGSQFELLSGIPTTYIWTSPVPADVLQRFSLIQKHAVIKDLYKDILIFRKNYPFSEKDLLFIDKLKETVAQT